MKKKFLNYSTCLLEASGNYSKEDIEVIIYGLEGIYLTITKAIIIFVLAYLLGIFKEVILLLICYNVIRSQAFGIHASKSSYCLISSVILFVGGAVICKYIVLPFWIMIICSIICDIGLLFYAPADTYKRPIVNKNKRKRFKIISVLFGVVYTISIVVFRDSSIVNYLLLGKVEAVVMIIPLTYKVFRLPYNNYKTYHCSV